MQYIMSLKGSQFIVGLFLALEGFVFFFGCAVVASPDNCDAYGPGVGLSVGWQAFYQVCLQSFTWTAFALLPYSTQCGEVTLLGRQARRAVAEERRKRADEKRRQREEKAKERRAKAAEAAKQATRRLHAKGGYAATQGHLLLKQWGECPV